jgi:hypothetical protein
MQNSIPTAPTAIELVIVYHFKIMFQGQSAGKRQPYDIFI